MHLLYEAMDAGSSADGLLAAEEIEGESSPEAENTLAVTTGETVAVTIGGAQTAKAINIQSNLTSRGMNLILISSHM
jgi:hypothetical protein